MTNSSNVQKIRKAKRNYDFNEWEDRKPSKKINKTQRGGKDKYYQDGESNSEI